MNKIRLNITKANTRHNHQIILNYVDEHARYGNRVFSGNFSGFSPSEVLKMLGFTVQRVGIKAFTVLQLSCLPEQQDSLLDLLNRLED